MSKLVAVATAVVVGAQMMVGTLRAAPADGSGLLTEVIPVKYAAASELAEFISAVSTNTADRDRIAVRFAPRGLKVLHTPAWADLQISTNFQVKADKRTNSLLVSGAPADLSQVKAVIGSYDITLRQVLVEAAVIELPLHGRAEARRASEEKLPWELAAFTNHPTGTFSQTEPVDAAKTNALDGWRYSAQLGLDLDSALSLLSTNARILQRPRIQTSEGVAATLFVGRSQPAFQGRGAAYSCGCPRPVDTTGITLEVLPTFPTNGSVVLDIRQQVDRFAGMVTVRNVGEVPVTESVTAQAHLALPDRATGLLGGAVRTERVSRFNEVKWVNHIPWIGRAVNSLIRSPKRSVRSELVLLVRPVLLPQPTL